MFYKRWRLMAKEDNTSVVLVGPKRHVYKEAGQPIVYNGEDIKENNFKALHVDKSRKKYLRYDWWDWKLTRIILSEQPDIVYLIGYESRNALLLTKIAHFLSRKKFKTGLFSMRGKDIPKWNKEYMWRWKLGRNWYDFIHVHYPEGKRVYQEQIGFKKPICMATQIGFDQDVYYPNKTVKSKIRQQYGIDEKTILFTAAMRIEGSKGLYEILEACRLLKTKTFSFLLMGDGKEMSAAQDYLRENQLEDKVILAGRVETGKNVAEHLNASDCFVHVPKNTKHWVDTFPLAVVQAMGCGLPVIGSRSGAVPYQTGNENPLLIPEGDSKALSDMMESVIEGKHDLGRIGQEAFDRARNCFEIRHLNTCLLENFEHYISGNGELIIDVAE